MQFSITAQQLPYPLQIPRSSSQTAFYNNQIYNFGGFSRIYHSDLQSIDLNSEIPQWIPRSRQQSQPQVRRGHTISQISPNSFVLFGGDSQNRYLNDLWVFSGSWRQITTDSHPDGRYGHCAAYFKNCLYVFGGKNPELQKLYDDCWKFDFATNTWTELQTTGPAARYGARFAVSGESIYLFGGQTAAGRVNDCWELKGDNFEIICPNNALEVPARSEHGCVALSDTKFLVFCGASEVTLNDCWVVDCNERTSKQLAVSLPARASFGYCVQQKTIGYGTFQSMRLADACKFADFEDSEVVKAVEHSIYVVAGADQQLKLADLQVIKINSLEKAREIEIQTYLNLKATRTQGGDVAELSTALDEFQAAVVQAFQALQLQQRETQSTAGRSAQQLAATNEKLDEFASTLTSFLKSSQIARMRQRIAALERENAVMGARVDKLERLVLQSVCIDADEKALFVQQFGGTNVKEDAASKAHELAAGLTVEQLDKRLIEEEPVEEEPLDASSAAEQQEVQNSVVKMEQQQLDVMQGQFDEIQQHCDDFDEGEELNLDEVDEFIGKLQTE